MDDTGTAINTAPWSKFLNGLKAAGVEIAFTDKTKKAYLKRVVQGRVFTAVLPSGFDLDNPDQSGGPGCMVFDSICRNLDLNPLKHFKGWYAAL